MAAESVELLAMPTHRPHRSARTAFVLLSVIFVADREETKATFGLDVYDMGLQPVLLEIANSGAVQLRYAPVCTDRYYFSPADSPYQGPCVSIETAVAS